MYDSVSETACNAAEHVTTVNEVATRDRMNPSSWIDYDFTSTLPSQRMRHTLWNCPVATLDFMTMDIIGSLKK